MFLGQWSTLTYFSLPFLDAKAYHQWALQILDGQILRNVAFYQSPLYPYILALIYKFFGTSTWPVTILQIMANAFTCGLFYLIAKDLQGRFAGWATGLLAVFYRPLIFYSVLIMKETFMILTLTAFLFSASRAFKQPHHWPRALTTGLLLGLTVLSRANVLVLAPLTLIFLFKLHRQTFKKNAAAFLAGLTLMILPATLHNWIASRDFVLINYTDGFNFYTGNSPSATGANSYPPEVSTDPAQEEADVTRIAQGETSEPIQPSEVSKYWYRKGLEFIKQNPQQELALLVNKTWNFWSNYEVPDNYDLRFVTRHLETILSWILVSFGIVSTLAAVGSAHFWRRSPMVPFLTGATLFYMVSVVAYYVTDRYRIPVVAFLFPLAGLGAQVLWELARQVRSPRHAWRSHLKKLALAIPFALVGFLPFPTDHAGLDAFNWGVIAAQNSDLGRDHAALESIYKVPPTHVHNLTTDALVKASTSAERLGQTTEAENLLKVATEIRPQDGLAWHNYGRFKYEHGDYRQARDIFTRAIEVMPWLYQPYLGLAVTYLRLGDRPNASAAITEGLKRAPNDSQLLKLKQEMER